MLKEITSSQNEIIKQASKLKEARQRKKAGLILIEGRRELALAVESKVKIEKLFYCPDFAGDDLSLLKRVPEENIIKTYKSAFLKISMRENPDGFLAIAKPHFKKLADTAMGENPMIIVLDGVEKPGNLGAVARTADAAGVDAILVTDPKTEIYNPNAIRASQGTVFAVNIVACTKEEAIYWLKKNSLRIIATTPRADKEYYESDLKQPIAVVFGAEDQGLRDEWLKSAEGEIKIEMKGKIDSLNVSVSVAVVVFEAVRQRNI